MLVKEIMNKYPITLSPSDTIRDAAERVAKYSVVAITVVDENEKVVGILTEGDLLYKKLRPHAPHYVNVLGASIYYTGISEYNKDFKKLLATTVAELMTKEVITCYENTDLAEAVRVMLEKHLKAIPVVNKDGRLKGVLNRREIMKAIADDYKLEEEKEANHK
ncbi:MAG: CBS domain-containing protein [Veillonellaceae bacterium]|nr:CBS domain-containing protein [Veillonellaceae bacterium]